MFRRAIQILAVLVVLGTAVLVAAAGPSRATPPDWPAAKAPCQQLGGDFRPWELYGADDTSHYIPAYSCFFPGPEGGGNTTEASLLANPKYRNWSKTCARYGGTTSIFERMTWVGPGPNDLGIEFVYATCLIQ